MKTINRPCRWAFFERRPGLALPGLHGILVALDGPALGLLHREPQATQDAPDLRLAELDTVQTFDDHANSLERPQLSAEAMLSGFVQQRPSQRLQLLAVQTSRAATRGHSAQRVDATLIEQRLPCVRGLPRHADRMRRFCRRLARQHHPTRSQAPPNRLVQSLLHHVCTQYLPSIGTTLDDVSGCHDLRKDQ
jgi:hypothetical protein